MSAFVYAYIQCVPLLELAALLPLDVTDSHSQDLIIQGGIPHSPDLHHLHPVQVHHFRFKASTLSHKGFERPRHQEAGGREREQTSSRGVNNYYRKMNELGSPWKQGEEKGGRWRSDLGWNPRSFRAGSEGMLIRESKKCVGVEGRAKLSPYDTVLSRTVQVGLPFFLFLHALIVVILRSYCPQLLVPMSSKTFLL